MRIGTFQGANSERFVGELEGERVHHLAAFSMIGWLVGDGRSRTGAVDELSAVQALAPVPEPSSVRDFFAFEEHVAAGWRLRGAEIPEAWYDAPVFYFANPASIHGPGEPVTRPAATGMLDFELEIAAVIGTDGRIAGFTLMNDWSARDVQAREMTVGLGPHKGKDFATSLGPLLVTPDELPWADGRLAVRAWVTVNGEEITRTDAAAQHFSWEEIVAHAARDTRLRAGDVLGSGTLARGCLLELNQPAGGEGRAEGGGAEGGAAASPPGPLGGRWIEPGDVVALHAEALGTLETPVVA